MFIAQALKFKHEWWRYSILPILFFGLMALNYMVIEILEIDVNTIMKDEIAKKGSNRVLFENLIPFAVFLLGLFLYVKFVHEQTIISLTTSRKKMDWGRFFFGFGLIAVLTVGLTLADFYTNSEHFEVQFELIPFLILLAIAIVFIPLQTSFEEYFFRGYLMQGIGIHFGNKWMPLIITSVVFGSLHYFNPEVEKLGTIVMIYYIGTGFFLGIITLMDEGMELALGFHAATNFVIAILVTTDWTVLQTNSILKSLSEPSLGYEILAPVFILYPIFIAIMAWKYKWTDWRNKLFGKVIPLNENKNIKDNYE